MSSRTNRRGVVAVVLITLAALIAACSSTGGKQESADSATAAGTADTPRMVVAMVTHAPPGDTFWDLIRKGAEAAAAKDNIELRYSNDPEAPNQANLVQNAIDSKVDAIAVTLAKPEAMRAVVAAAEEAGIPVVAFNGGTDQWQDMGIRQYFGIDDRLSGEILGQRLSSEGRRKAICVNPEQGHVALEARCAGVAEGFTGGTSEVLNVRGTDISAVTSMITAKLQQDPSIDVVVGLGAANSIAAVQSVQDAGSDAAVVSFDTNADMVDYIKSGEIEWAIDQQPYLQGYLAIDSAWLYLNNRNVIGGGQPVLTGPSFVDQTNIDDIAEFVTAGVR